jgi:hypothetical protein
MESHHLQDVKAHERKSSLSSSHTDIVKSKPKLRKLLIYNVLANFITAICECSLNLLKVAPYSFRSVSLKFCPRARLVVLHATRVVDVACVAGFLKL